MCTLFVNTFSHGRRTDIGPRKNKHGVGVGLNVHSTPDPRIPTHKSHANTHAHTHDTTDPSRWTTFTRSGIWDKVLHVEPVRLANGLV